MKLLAGQPVGCEDETFRVVRILQQGLPQVSRREADLLGNGLPRPLKVSSPAGLHFHLQRCSNHRAAPSGGPRKTHGSLRQMPPSTLMITPETNRDRSLARNSAAPA